LKVLTEVAKFSTYGFNYPTTFSNRIFTPSPRLPAQKFYILIRAQTTIMLQVCPQLYTYHKSRICTTLLRFACSPIINTAAK